MVDYSLFRRDPSPPPFHNLKVLHDSYKEKARIAIAGSSSLRLLQGTSESLGGRVELAVMYPLSFLEILNRSSKAVWLKKSMSQFSDIQEEISVFKKVDHYKCIMLHSSV